MALRPRKQLAACLILVAIAVAGWGGDRRIARAIGQAQVPPPKTIPEPVIAQATQLLDRTDYKAAAPLFARALEEAEAAHDNRAIAAALKGLSICRWGLGDSSGATVLRVRLLTLARELGDMGLERDTLNGLGLDAYSQGAYARALEYYGQALDANRKAPSARLEGLVYANIGLVYRYQGRFTDAVAAFERSLAIRREIKDDPGIAQTLNHLGIVNRAMGRFDRAIEFYTQSLEIRKRVGDRQGEAQTLNNMGNVYLDQSERERALELYQASYTIADEIGYTLQIGLAQSNIGHVLETLDRPREALARFEAALVVFRQLSRRSQIADGLRSIGWMHSVLGDQVAAAADFEASLAEARAIGEPEAEARTLDELGVLALARGRVPEARTRFDEGLALVTGHDMPDIEYSLLANRAAAEDKDHDLDAAVRDLRASAAIITSLRARLTTDLGKIGFLDRRTRVFEQLAGALLRMGKADEALEAAESGRARAFADLLSTRQVSGSPDGREPLEHLRQAVAIEHAASPSADLAGATTGTVESALETLRGRDRELASLIAVDSPRIDEIRATAARLHATMVEYLVADAETFVWVVRPDGQLNAATIRLSRAALDQLTSTQASTKWRAIGRLLIDPIDAWLPRAADALVVLVAPGPLSGIAFAAVIDRMGEPLIARHTIVYAPAISAYRYSGDRLRAAPAFAGARALVIADPTPPPDSQLTPIPASRDEARAITAVLGATRTRVLTGSDATESAARELMPGAGVVHIAAHGVIAPDRPLASSIALATSASDDGYLRVDEVFGLSLHARLVVLSGCSTATGRVTGDGVLGLARAFLYAGTPTIIVSQWDVKDRATAFLMERFYVALGRGTSVAGSLRRAQLEARARYPAVASWAGFLVIGEP